MEGCSVPFALLYSQARWRLTHFNITTPGQTTLRRFNPLFLKHRMKTEHICKLCMFLAGSKDDDSSAELWFPTGNSQKEKLGMGYKGGLCYLIFPLAVLFLHKGFPNFSSCRLNTLKRYPKLPTSAAPSSLKMKRKCCPFLTETEIQLIRSKLLISSLLEGYYPKISQDPEHTLRVTLLGNWPDPCHHKSTQRMPPLH